MDRIFVLLVPAVFFLVVSCGDENGGTRSGDDGSFSGTTNAEGVTRLTDEEKVEAGVAALASGTVQVIPDGDEEEMEQAPGLLSEVPVVYTHEILAEDLVIQIERLAELVGEVEDLDSAERLEQRMREVVDAINGLNARTKRMGEPDEEEASMLREKFEARTVAAAKLLQAHIRALEEKPETLRFVGRILEGMK